MCCPQGVLSLAGGAILSGGAMKGGFMKGCSMKGVFHGRGCHEGGTMKDPPPGSVNKRTVQRKNRDFFNQKRAVFDQNLNT